MNDSSKAEQSPYLVQNPLQAFSLSFAHTQASFEDVPTDMPSKMQLD